MTLTIDEIIAAASKGKAATKRTRKLGVQSYAVRGKKVGGGRRLAPDNPLPSVRAATDGIKLKKSEATLRAEAEAEKQRKLREHAERQLEKQRKLREDAQRELRRLLRSL